MAHQARQIYRTTLGVLFATALATGLAGISFLQQTVYDQSGTDISHSLAAISSHIETTIDDRADRAVAVALAPTLQTAAARMIAGADTAASATQPAYIGEDLLAHGFSGIGVESGSATPHPGRATASRHDPLRPHQRNDRCRACLG